MKVLYIGGAGRSGSTLIEMILGNVPGVFAMGEISGFWGYLQEGHFLCGCGAPLEECDIWGKVIDRLGLRAPERVVGVAHLSRKIDRTRNLAWMPLFTRLEAREIKELAREIGRLYEVVQEVTGATVLVDSSKAPVHLHLLTKTPSMDLRILHLIRDARAVAYSWNQRAKRQLSTSQAGVYMDRRGLYSSVVRWAVENAATQSQGRWSEHYTVMRYEDFVQHPYDRLHEALSGLGLQEVEPSLLRSSGTRLLATHSLGGNPVRFTQRELRIVADDEWRSKMPRMTQYVLGMLATPWLRRYGYAI